MKAALALLLIAAAFVAATVADSPCPVCSVDQVIGDCSCPQHKQTASFRNGTEFHCCADFDISDKKWWKDLISGAVSGFFG